MKVNLVFKTYNNESSFKKHIKTNLVGVLLGDTDATGMLAKVVAAVETELGLPEMWSSPPGMTQHLFLKNLMSSCYRDVMLDRSSAKVNKLLIGIVNCDLVQIKWIISSGLLKVYVKKREDPKTFW